MAPAELAALAAKVRAEVDAEARAELDKATEAAAASPGAAANAQLKGSALALIGRAPMIFADAAMAFAKRYADGIVAALGIKLDSLERRASRSADHLARLEDRVKALETGGRR